jgi:hypothetical protein
LAFPAITVHRLFPCGPDDCLSSYRPLNQLRPGSSFRGVPPPQSSFAQISRRHVSVPAHLPRVSSLIAASPERVHIVAKVAMPSLRSVLRFSQPLDGFLRPPALRACFIPQPRPGLSPFRGFSPRAAVLPHREPLPPCRCRPEPSPVLFDGSLSRPAGGPAARPADASASRLFSARGSVAYGSGLASPQPAPLFGFHLLQVFNHRLDLGSPRSPALDVRRPQRISAAG